MCVFPHNAVTVQAKYGKDVPLDATAGDGGSSSSSEDEEAAVSGSRLLLLSFDSETLYSGIMCANLVIAVILVKVLINFLISVSVPEPLPIH